MVASYMDRFHFLPIHLLVFTRRRETSPAIEWATTLWIPVVHSKYSIQISINEYKMNTSGNKLAAR